MIIAIDFDGVLAENNSQFPEIGPPIYPMISFARELIDMGHEVVLWTSRTDGALENAVSWCADRGLHFCAVNDNTPSNKAMYASMYPNGTRKVSADVYIDDHNPTFIRTQISEGTKSAINSEINHVRRILEWHKKQES